MVHRSLWDRCFRQDLPACISPRTSCAGSAGKSLRANRTRFSSVALGTRTASITLNSLRTGRTLIAPRPDDSPFMAVRIAFILMAVA